MELTETAMTDLFLTCDQDVLGKALVRLYETKIPDLGFDETDIVTARYMVIWFKNKRKLTGVWVYKARLLAIKYRFQLLTIAKEKAARVALKKEAARQAEQG